MLIYRGQNHKVGEFSIQQGNNMSMSEEGIGLYFFDFKHRSRAYVYSLFNHEVLFDEDAEEELDSGYFYECELVRGTSRPLNEVEMSEISNIEEWVSSAMKGGEFDVNFTDQYSDGDIQSGFKCFVEVLNNCDNAYEAIQCMFDTMSYQCKQAFLKSISTHLDELDSCYAIPNEKNGEVVVLNPEHIRIIRTLEVSQDDLNRTREERMSLVRPL